MCKFVTPLSRTALAAFVLFALALPARTVFAEGPGLLDRPTDTASPTRVELLQRAVQQEQEALEALERDELAVRAESGERVAQVALGADFAKEAGSLAFSPAAANDALSDAAEWYSRAADPGFPDAPSLDQAGVRFYPIRIQRQQR